MISGGIRANWFRLQNPIGGVQSRDGLEMVIVGEEDGAGVEGAGGDVDVLDGKGDALAVESPGEVERFFPACG